MSVIAPLIAAAAAAVVSEITSASAAAADVAPPAARRARPPLTEICPLCGRVGHRERTCKAHLQPDVIIHLPAAKKKRFATHLEALARQAAEKQQHQGAAVDQAQRAVLGLTIVDSVKEPELIFVRTPTPQDLVYFVQHSPLLQRHFMSIFVSGMCDNTFDEMVTGIVKRTKEISEQMAGQQAVQGDAAAAAGEAATAAAAAATAPPTNTCTLRVQTHPKPLRAQLLPPLVSSGVMLHPHSFTHVLFAAKAYNRYYWSVEDRRLFYHAHAADSHATAEGSSASDVLSRAYFKLDELWLSDPVLRSRVQPGDRAIDIGASPGGWSAFLASQGCKVLAVDPGVVHCTSPLVTHVAKRVEEAIADGDVTRFAHTLGEGESADSTGLSLVVCDMNVRPLASVSLIRTLCESSPCPLSRARGGAMLVLTCKETTAGRSKRLVSEAQADLADWWTDFRHCHLLSNGKERTLVARMRDATPEERQATREQRARDVAEEKAAWDEKVKDTPSPYELLQAKLQAKQQKKEAAAARAQAQAQAQAAATASAAPI